MGKEAWALPAVKQYRLFMGLLGCGYLIAGLIFFFAPGFIFHILNYLPMHYGVFEMMPASSEEFWLPLATSMMMMLVVLAFGAAAQPENRLLSVVHMVSKFCSSAGYLIFFFTRADYGAYLLGTLTDFPIFIFVGVITWRCARALKQAEGAAA